MKHVNEAGKLPLQGSLFLTRLSNPEYGMLNVESDAVNSIFAV